MNDLPEPTGESSGVGLRDLAHRPGFWIGLFGFVLVARLAANDSLEGFLVILVAALLYFFPAVIARKKPNGKSVFVINLFLGWTLIGWVVALAMAVSNPPPPVVLSQGTPVSNQPQNDRKCPFCAEDIKAAAIVCKHCGRDLPETE